MKLTRVAVFEKVLGNEKIQSNNLKIVFQDNLDILKNIEQYFVYDGYVNTSNEVQINDTEKELLDIIKGNEIIQKYIEVEENPFKNIKNPKNIFNKILNISIHHSNKLIDIFFDQEINQEPFEFFSDIIGSEEKYTKVFLSYAYTDKAYTLALFLSLLNDNILLYVDWMHNKKISSGVNLKMSLNTALRDSQQLLFLRSKNSELHLPGATIRPWCAWELGSFYMLGKKKDKFYLRIYDHDVDTTSSQFNLLLDGVTELTSIQNGRLG